MNDRDRADDLVSIAPDPLDVDDGAGFPPSQRQPEGGDRPADEGGFWQGGHGGGPSGQKDDEVDWEDRQRPGMAGEA